MTEDVDVCIFTTSSFNPTVKVSFGTSLLLVLLTNLFCIDKMSNDINTLTGWFSYANSFGEGINPVSSNIACSPVEEVRTFRHCLPGYFNWEKMMVSLLNPQIILLKLKNGSRFILVTSSLIVSKNNLEISKHFGFC